MMEEEDERRKGRERTKCLSFSRLVRCPVPFSRLLLKCPFPFSLSISLGARIRVTSVPPLAWRAFVRILSVGSGQVHVRPSVRSESAVWSSLVRSVCRAVVRYAIPCSFGVPSLSLVCSIGGVGPSLTSVSRYVRACSFGGVGRFFRLSPTYVGLCSPARSVPFVPSRRSAGGRGCPSVHSQRSGLYPFAALRVLRH